MELILSEDERELLSNILEQRHREILKEISHTDNREFRRVLRRNEKVIEELLSQLRGSLVEA